MFRLYQFKASLWISLWLKQYIGCKYFIESLSYRELDLFYYYRIQLEQDWQRLSYYILGYKVVRFLSVAENFDKYSSD